MQIKNKRHIILPLALLAYSAVMAYIAFPRYQESGNWNEYYLILAGCVLLAFSLFIILKRRQKIRDNFTKND